MSDGSSTGDLQPLLDRLRGGDDAARAALIERSAGRFRRLARRMLGGFNRLRRWEDTDDVSQGAVLRLWTALRSDPPVDPAAYFRLASAVIRRELIDLTRHHFGPEGGGANHGSVGSTPPEPADTTSNPARLAEWSEFHSRVEDLPETDRLLFDLLWYHGLTLAEAAAVTGESERTARRRWRAARTRLAGEFPADPFET
jgi:RNA polymerase sigma-70 factor (ECF subfamily)